MAIKKEINNRISGNEVNTASWIPNADDWTTPPFEPIYTKACKSDPKASGKCFGLFVWVTFMERTDDYWGFGRYSKNDIPIKGMTYFKVTP